MSDKIKIGEINCPHAKKWALENNQDESLNTPFQHDFGKGESATLEIAFSWHKSAQGNDFWIGVHNYNPPTEQIKKEFPDLYKDIESSEFPFKVGDRVTQNTWEESEYFDIKFIDWKKKKLYGETNEGSCGILDLDSSFWQLYQEEKPKDLADVFEYYTVSNKDGTKVSKCYGDKKHFEEHKFKNKHRDVEVITKEEAQERGLKVD